MVCLWKPGGFLWGPQDGSAWKVPSGGSVRIIAPDDYYFGPLIETAATRTALRMWLRLVISKHVKEQKQRQGNVEILCNGRLLVQACMVWPLYQYFERVTCLESPYLSVKWLSDVRIRSTGLWAISTGCWAGGGRLQKWSKTVSWKYMKISGCVSITPYALNSLNALLNRSWWAVDSIKLSSSQDHI